MDTISFDEDDTLSFNESLEEDADTLAVDNTAEAEDPTEEASKVEETVTADAE